MKFTSKLGLAALLAVSIAASPALAADAVVESAPVVEQAVLWTGPYLGLGVGYHWGDLDVENCVGLCPDDPQLDGVTGFVQGGFDYQFANNVVLGAFAVIPFVGPDDSFDLLPGIGFDYDTKFAAFFSGRVGYAFNNVLPYVHGGFHVAKVEADGPSIAPVDTDENTHHGYQLGAGVEWLFTEHVSTNLRYTYSDTSEETYDFGGGASDWSETANNLSVSVNYRF